MTLGEKIKVARKSKGWTQDQLAEKIMVPRAAVTKWENDNGIPDIENLKKLSELFSVTIDELLDNAMINDCKSTAVGDNYYAMYMGKKCDVDLVDWNDGVTESYILCQDELFIYYVTVEKNYKKIGALAKRYIKSIILCPEKGKRVSDYHDFKEIQKDYFLGKPVDLYFENKYFWSGLLGEDTEILGVGITEINENYIKLVQGKEIEVRKLTKIETISKSCNSEFIQKVD